MRLFPGRHRQPRKHRNDVQAVELSLCRSTLRGGIRGKISIFIVYFRWDCSELVSTTFFIPVCSLSIFREIFCGHRSRTLAASTGGRTATSYAAAYLLRRTRSEALRHCTV